MRDVPTLSTLTFFVLEEFERFQLFLLIKNAEVQLLSHLFRPRLNFQEVRAAFEVSRNLRAGTTILRDYDSLVLSCAMHTRRGKVSLEKKQNSGGHLSKISTHIRAMKGGDLVDQSQSKPGLGCLC